VDTLPVVVEEEQVRVALVLVEVAVVVEEVLAVFLQQAVPLIAAPEVVEMHLLAVPV
jgi:hypothetical protein